MGDRLRLLGLIGLEAGAVAVLHGLGRLEFFRVEWGDLATWLDETPGEDVLGAVLRLVALAIACWLLLSTVAYWLASRSGRSGAISAAGILTLPAVRRLVSRTVTLSIAAASVAGPVMPAVAGWLDDSQATPVVVEVATRATLPPPGSDRGARDEMIGPPHLRNGEAEEEPSPDPATPLDPTTTHRYRVVRGDHLWSIAADHLEAITGRDDLEEHEIAPYWVQVINANRPSLRSGDPDLIYPGEVISLPPVEP